MEVVEAVVEEGKNTMEERRIVDGVQGVDLLKSKYNRVVPFLSL